MRYCNQEIPDSTDHTTCFEPAYRERGTARYCKECFANAISAASNDFEETRAEYEKMLRVYLSLLQSKDVTSDA